MTTELTDDNESSRVSSDRLWHGSSQRPKETVNRAIVDIYDSDEGCDPFLKMRVSSVGSAVGTTAWNDSVTCFLGNTGKISPTFDYAQLQRDTQYQAAAIISYQLGGNTKDSN